MVDPRTVPLSNWDEFVASTLRARIGTEGADAGSSIEQGMIERAEALAPGGDNHPEPRAYLDFLVDMSDSNRPGGAWIHPQNAGLMFSDAAVWYLTNGTETEVSATINLLLNQTVMMPDGTVNTGTPASLIDDSTYGSLGSGQTVNGQTLGLIDSFLRNPVFQPVDGQNLNEFFGSTEFERHPLMVMMQHMTEAQRAALFAPDGTLDNYLEQLANAGVVDPDLVGYEFGDQAQFMQAMYKHAEVLDWVEDVQNDITGATPDADPHTVNDFMTLISGDYNGVDTDNINFATADVNGPELNALRLERLADALTTQQLETLLGELDPAQREAVLTNPVFADRLAEQPEGNLLTHAAAFDYEMRQEEWMETATPQQIFELMTGDLDRSELGLPGYIQTGSPLSGDFVDNLNELIAHTPAYADSLMANLTAEQRVEFLNALEGRLDQLPALEQEHRELTTSARVAELMTEMNSGERGSIQEVVNFLQNPSGELYGVPAEDYLAAFTAALARGESVEVGGTTIDGMNLRGFVEMLSSDQRDALLADPEFVAALGTQIDAFRTVGAELDAQVRDMANVKDRLFTLDPTSAAFDTEMDTLLADDTALTAFIDSFTDVREFADFLDRLPDADREALMAEGTPFATAAGARFGTDDDAYQTALNEVGTISAVTNALRDGETDKNTVLQDLVTQHPELAERVLDNLTPDELRNIAAGLDDAQTLAFFGPEGSLRGALPDDALAGVDAVIRSDVMEDLRAQVRDGSITVADLIARVGQLDGADGLSDDDKRALSDILQGDLETAEIIAWAGADLQALLDSLPEGDPLRGEVEIFQRDQEIRNAINDLNTNGLSVEGLEALVAAVDGDPALLESALAQLNTSLLDDDGNGRPDAGVFTTLDHATWQAIAGDPDLAALQGSATWGEISDMAQTYFTEQAHTLAEAALANINAGLQPGDAGLDQLNNLLAAVDINGDGDLGDPGEQEMLTTYLNQIDSSALVHMGMASWTDFLASLETEYGSNDGTRELLDNLQNNPRWQELLGEAGHYFGVTQFISQVLDDTDTLTAADHSNELLTRLAGSSQFADVPSGPQFAADLGAALTADNAFDFLDHLDHVGHLTLIRDEAFINALSDDALLALMEDYRVQYFGDPGRELGGATWGVIEGFQNLIDEVEERNLQGDARYADANLRADQLFNQHAGFIVSHALDNVQNGRQPFSEGDLRILAENDHFREAAVASGIITATQNADGNWEITAASTDLDQMSALLILADGYISQEEMRLMVQDVSLTQAVMGMTDLDTAVEDAIIAQAQETRGNLDHHNILGIGDAGDDANDIRNGIEGINQALAEAGLTGVCTIDGIEGVAVPVGGEQQQGGRFRE